MQGNGNNRKTIKYKRKKKTFWFLNAKDRGIKTYSTGTCCFLICKLSWIKLPSQGYHS